MKRYPWLAFLLGFAGGCGGGEKPESTASAGSPSVILVTLDTTRADRIGSYGHQAAQTETIDAFAATGQRFTRAYAPVPLTIPSHASLMTGLHPFNHRVRSNSTDVLGDEFQTLAEVLRDEGYQTWASVAAFVTQSSWGFGQGFDAYAQELGVRAVDRHDNAWQQERPAEAVIDDAIGFLGQKKQGAPYFLWVHLFDAHEPLRPPEAYRGEGVDLYDAEIAYMDDQLARLKKAVGDEEVLWVITADHGESLGEHGEQTHGLFVYNSTQHVPLILSGPNIAVAVEDQPVGLVDVFPTVLNRLGVDVPEGLDGKPQPGNPQPIYLESYELLKRYAWAPHVAVVDGEKKYIQTPRPELYDQSSDWAEVTNLWGEQNPIAQELSGKLDAFGASSPEAPSLELDAETAQKLAALGYIDGADGWASGTSTVDVKDKSEVLELILGAAAIIDHLEGTQITPDSERAVAMLEEAIAKEPGILESYMRLSRLHTKLGRHQKANSVLEKALENWPESINLMLTIAVNAGSIGDFGTVDRYARQAYEINPSSVRALELLMSSLFMRGQTQAAIAFGEEYLDRNPDSPVIAGFLGLHMAGSAQYETEDELRQIQDYLKLGLEAQFPRQGIRHALAMMAHAAEADEDVIRLASAELRDYPKALRTRRLLLRMLAEQKRYEEQLPHWEYLRAQVPDSVDLMHSHAQALWNAKKHGESEQVVLDGLIKDPNHPDLLMLQANHLSRNGEEDKAQETYQRALAAKKARDDGRGPDAQ